MEYAQDLNFLQAGTNTIRHDIACFWNDEFVSARQPPGMAKRGVIAQQGNSVVDALHYKPGGLGVILSNILYFLI